MDETKPPKVEFYPHLGAGSPKAYFCTSRVSFVQSLATKEFVVKRSVLFFTVPQPFTAPAAIPFTKYLLQNANATSTGSMAIDAPASIRFHDAADSPDDLSAISPTIKVRWLGVVSVKMLGMR